MTLSGCPSGGSPGGANTQVQYNNASAFGGDADFIFDGTDSVGIGTSTPARQLGVAGGIYSGATTTSAQGFITATGTVQIGEIRLRAGTQAPAADATSTLGIIGSGGFTSFYGNLIPIAEIVSTSTAAGLEITGLPARQELYVQFYSPGRSLTVGTRLRFNDDGTAVYSSNAIQNSAGGTVPVGVTETTIGFITIDGDLGSRTIWSEFKVMNHPNRVKTITNGHTFNYGATLTSGVTQTWGGAWDNTTAQITSIQIVTSDGTAMNAGSFIRVFASPY